MVDCVTFVLNDAQTTWSKFCPSKGFSIVMRSSCYFAMRSNRRAAGTVGKGTFLLSGGRKGLHRSWFL